VVVIRKQTSTERGEGETKLDRGKERENKGTKLAGGYKAPISIKEVVKEGGGQVGGAKTLGHGEIMRETKMTIEAMVGTRKIDYQ